MSWIRAALWSTIAAMLGLTFVWPYAVSADPANEAFRVAAIITLVLFLAALLVAAILRCKDPRTSS